MNVHGKEGAKQMTPADMMPFRKAWPAPGQEHYSDLDREVLEQL